LTDWPAVFAEHYGDLVTWARGFVPDRHDPEFVVSEAFQSLYFRDTEAKTPVALWKVAIRRQWAGVIKRENIHKRAVLKLVPSLSETADEPTFLTAMPDRRGTSNNPIGYGTGYVLPTVECALDGCTERLAPRATNGGRRVRYCSHECSAAARRMTVCPRCGSDDISEGRNRRCRPCRNERERERYAA
jgi:hypothetical protein